jgi:hypothetical protein
MDALQVEETVGLLRDSYQEHLTKCKKPHIQACKFHSALITDPEFAQKVLEKLRSDEIAFVLSALVDYSSPQDYAMKNSSVPNLRDFKISDTIKEELIKRHSIKRYQLVAGLVAYGGNISLMRKLIDLGLNLMLKDDSGDTVLHTLVDLSELQPDKAIITYDVVISALPDDDSRRQLVFERNDQGETALDAACRQWLPEMTHALLNTKNVYKFLAAQTGTQQYSCYDLTEFEARKRNGRLTPMHHLCVIPEKMVRRIDDFGFLQKEPVRSWVEEVFIVAQPLICTWLIGWTSAIIGYIIALAYLTSKETTESTKFVMNAVIVGLAVAGLISEIFFIRSTVTYNTLLIRNFLRGVYPIAMTIMYRSMQMYFLVTVVVIHSILILEVDTCSVNTALRYVFIFMQVSNVTNGVVGLLFFVQLSRRLGNLVILVEKMSAAVLFSPPRQSLLLHVLPLFLPHHIL